jgi:hypothetical protein
MTRNIDADLFHDGDYLGPYLAWLRARTLDLCGPSAAQLSRKIALEVIAAFGKRFPVVRSAIAFRPRFQPWHRLV